MSGSVLITGGAGFIGSHLADELLRHGYRVRVLDSLVPQVHGPDAGRPSYLDLEVELIKGDVRDPAAVQKALIGTEAVFHMAAMVGVGQSMYEIERYTSANNCGTAVLLEAMAQARGDRKLIVASSMSIYGEGRYRDSSGACYDDVSREVGQLQRGDWEPLRDDREPLIPVPTPEEKTPSLASVYALSKYDQERMALIVGNCYRIPVIALRLFNVYGTRQALSNPYTGVLAIFASRLMNGNPPRIFEDGRQLRDFVSVHDVATGCRLALEVDQQKQQLFNIGSGANISVLQVLERFCEVLNLTAIEPEITGSYRAGDIRHCFADIKSAKEILGYAPRVPFVEGLRELANWLEGEVAVDRVAEAHAELAQRGLTL
ncbi:NAD-dependent epimerase/dehydratase family protein [Geomonas oryzisoli]|uniref:NAD-dependent epimerase/dehydratase family protein n=1 Tax=Geomonas oryzisoli TaxID=2847992 RepID=A0ABX8J4E0_9BACT|nr:NAD-dependent epimerase/dehydratase family protein [Geomonas oryzisoli]QWV91906.1 NAD-dependent epimerase/dehydratase family protein [Geomonas oryzisoli]